ncbi:hypothetical protein SAMN03159443_01769 [Pseudomonas sp. NFACC15-1]|nr:hypothetical protein SAMN03159443_01769 [Pseudomonas sp. NFACC15-1]SDX97540.1 hypothetical protein SAMN03159380_03242 [Pseudomonas sp. NFACC14]
MRTLKTLLLTLLLILSLIGLDRPQAWNSPSPPVGASLLAIAVVQSDAVSAVPPSSRASSLPQGGSIHSGLEH